MFSAVNDHTQHAWGALVDALAAADVVASTDGNLHVLVGAAAVDVDPGQAEGKVVDNTGGLPRRPAFVSCTSVPFRIAIAPPAARSRMAWCWRPSASSG